MPIGDHNTDFGKPWVSVLSSGDGGQTSVNLFDGSNVSTLEQTVADNFGVPTGRLYHSDGPLLELYEEGGGVIPKSILRDLYMTGKPMLFQPLPQLQQPQLQQPLLQQPLPPGKSRTNLWVAFVACLTVSITLLVVTFAAFKPKQETDEEKKKEIQTYQKISGSFSGIFGAASIILLIVLFIRRSG